MFKALLLEQQDKQTIATITQLDESQLPAENVTPSALKVEKDLMPIRILITVPIKTF
jgi:hypothetical protein